MKPAASAMAYPSAFKPSPLICECGAIREERAADAVDGGGKALCATGAEDVEAMVSVGVQVIQAAAKHWSTTR